MKKRKSLKKTMATLTSLAMIAGALSSLPLSASAASAEPAAQTASPQMTTGQAPSSAPASASEALGTYPSLLLNSWLKDVVGRAASLSSQDSQTVKDALSSGATLAQATGLSQSELVDKLVDQFNSDMDLEASKGTLSSNELAQLKASARSALSDAVASNGLAAAKSEGDAVVSARLRQIISDTASLSGIGSVDLKNALRQGQNLLQASGLDETTLVDGLTQKLNLDIDMLASRGLWTAEELSALKADGKKKIERIISTNGYDGEGETALMKAYGTKLLKDFYDSALTTAAVHSDNDYSAVLAAVKGGADLSTATGIDAKTLSDQLLAVFNGKVEQEWQNGSLSAKLADQLKADAAKQVPVIVTTKAYGSDNNANTAASDSTDADAVIPVNGDQYVQQRLDRVMDDIAGMAGKSVSELYRSAVSGGSIAKASGLNSDTIKLQLIGDVRQELNADVAAGSISEKDALAAIAKYESQLVDLLAGNE